MALAGLISRFCATSSSRAMRYCVHVLAPLACGSSAVLDAVKNQSSRMISSKCRAHISATCFTYARSAGSEYDSVPPAESRSCGEYPPPPPPHTPPLRPRRKRHRARHDHALVVEKLLDGVKRLFPLRR